jgi:putative transposase
VVLAAAGVDEQGDKHVLGLREGATENGAAVRALLADLAERGLVTDRSLALRVVGGTQRLARTLERPGRRPASMGPRTNGRASASPASN